MTKETLDEMCGADEFSSGLNSNHLIATEVENINKSYEILSKLGVKFIQEQKNIMGAKGCIF